MIEQSLKVIWGQYAGLLRTESIVFICNLLQQHLLSQFWCWTMHIWVLFQEVMAETNEWLGHKLLIADSRCKKIPAQLCSENIYTKKFITLLSQIKLVQFTWFNLDRCPCCFFSRKVHEENVGFIFRRAYCCNAFAEKKHSRNPQNDPFQQ